MGADGTWVSSTLRGKEEGQGGRRQGDGEGRKERVRRKVGGEKEELVKEETLGSPVCPLPAESDPQMLPETRKRGSCSRAFCIWPSISFQLLVLPRSS